MMKMKKKAKSLLLKVLTMMFNYDTIITEREVIKMLTEMERYKINAENHGLEVNVIGNTLQWTMPTGQTCIQWFTPEGEWVCTQWV